MAFPVSDSFRQAIRSGAAVTYSVDAYLAGVPVAGAQDLAPTGGSITDTTKPGVRRVLNLSLAPERGLFDLLSPIGTELRVTAHVQFQNKATVDVPMGVFVVDSERLSEGGGDLSLTAPDKWVKIQRARFIGPAAAAPGLSVPEQIARMIRDVLGPGEPVNVLTSNAPWMPPMVWEKDRDKAINDLARDIGCWVFFDRNGVATIADVPSAGAADWLVDASASGVLIELDRERSRSNAFNVVVVSSSASDGEAFPTVFVWDQNPSSPTYAGTDPRYGWDVGPFGIAPYYHDTPLPLDIGGAYLLGESILSRVVGLAASVSLGQVPNPAVDAFDVFDVLPPGSSKTVVLGYETVPTTGGLGFGEQPFGESPFGGVPGTGGVFGFATQPFGTSPFGGTGGRGRPILGTISNGAFMERHIADTVTHPLTLGPAQTIEGRSTRADEFA